MHNHLFVDAQILEYLYLISVRVEGRCVIIDVEDGDIHNNAGGPGGLADIVRLQWNQSQTTNYKARRILMLDLSLSS